MTVLEFWGCALIAFGPTLAMFSLTVAHNPIKVILLISSSFFWLMSFFVVAISWAVISSFCDYLIVGAILAVISQEAFRYLFHIATKKAQFHLAKIIGNESYLNRDLIRTNQNQIVDTGFDTYKDRIPFSYVSGLGFGIMNGAFSLTNVLTDYIGPGSVGLKGDSQYFLLVSSLTALAFIILNVEWSVLMSESIEKSDKKLTMIVIATHLIATSATFVNKFHLQLISITVVYALTVLCGIGALKVAGLSPSRLMSRSNGPVVAN